MPTQGLSHEATQEGGGSSSKVDAHVEDGEPAIPTRVAVWVEIADDRRDVGFEEPIANDQKRQGGKERIGLFNTHDEVASCHQQTTEHDGPTGAQEPVRDHAADKWGHVHQRRVRAVHHVRIFILIIEEALDHIEDEQGPHTVVAESLPHLCEEQHEQGCGVAEQGRAFSRSGSRHGYLV